MTAHFDRGVDKAVEKMGFLLLVIKLILLSLQVRTFVLMVSITFLACFSALAQGRRGGLEQELVRAGFVNVRTWENDSLRVVALENDAYKLQAQGITEALKYIVGDGAKPVKVIVTSRNIPQVTLTYDPSIARWKTTYRLDDSWDKVRHRTRTGSSLGKFDIVVYPQLALKNLIITQVYQSLWDLSPALEVSLWPGMQFSYMVKIPVYNDGYGRYESKVHPGHVTLSQSFRLPYDVFGKFTMGAFNVGAYGLDLQMRHPLLNERFALEGRLGYIGSSFFDGFNFNFYTTFNWVWSVGGSYYWPKEQTEFSLKAEQFLFGDRGVKFEMIRHFRYTSVGFYAEKAHYAPTNGGFRFQIALPPYRMKRHGNWPRVTTSGQMGMVYNANNERYYYKEYKAEASDNIMEHNAFNPLYIDSEIVKLIK